MRNPRHLRSVDDGRDLLSRLEGLEVENDDDLTPRGEESVPDLALTIRRLAERIAELVANQLAEDLLSLPTGGGERKGEGPERE